MRDHVTPPPQVEMRAHQAARAAEQVAATFWDRMKPARDAMIATAVLVSAIYAGSGRFAGLDPALLGYVGATLVATFGVAWRMSAFWRRVPSAFYARALGAALLRPRRLPSLASHAAGDLGAQRFIVRRGRLRGAAHLALSFGTLASFAITLPLVWGWLRFEPRGQETYVVRVGGVAAGSFDVDGPVAWLMFHGLTVAAVAVVAGAGAFLAMRLRARGEPSHAGAFHVAPLALLLVVALTGLALPATRALPRLFDAAALAHEIAVVALLVALPFSKLGHVLIRPLQLGVRVVHAGREDAAACASCGGPVAPAAQLAAVEHALATHGFRFGGHQRACPPCRRRLVAAAQATLLGAGFQPRIAAARPAPPRPPVEEAA